MNNAHARKKSPSIHNLFLLRWRAKENRIIKKKKTTAKKIEGNITLDFAGGRDTYISGDYELKHENGLSRKCELNTNVTNAKGFILSRLSHLNGGIAFVIAAPFLSVPFLLLALTYLILLPPSLDAIWYEINLVLNDTVITIDRLLFIFFFLLKEIHYFFIEWN